MKDKVKRKIERLRENYAQVKGNPFDHFYCPILFRDEDVPLCQAHIINEAFCNSSRSWTIQRQDVDNFYGHSFEADFIAIQYETENLTPGDVITDRKLYRQFRPSILVDDKPVDYFVAHNGIPDHFTPIEIVNEEESIGLGLKISPKDFIFAVDGHWEIEINKDVRLAALVSLVKAAHLTLFEMLGYHYVFSPGGYFVGRQVLGEFFLKHHNRSKAEVAESADSFFREFSNMVRPVISSHFDLRGTIADGQLFACRDSSSDLWALIVFIRTSSMLHSVMIPFNQPDSVVKFMRFLKNENEEIEVSRCCFVQEQWVVSKSKNQLFWPKSGILYP